jgi:hypothetical protein
MPICLVCLIIDPEFLLMEITDFKIF